jgi:hypothetical protein
MDFITSIQELFVRGLALDSQVHGKKFCIFRIFLRRGLHEYGTWYPMADFHYHMALCQVEDSCDAERICELGHE